MQQNDALKQYSTFIGDKQIQRSTKICIKFYLHLFMHKLIEVRTNMKNKRIKYFRHFHQPKFIQIICISFAIGITKISECHTSKKTTHWFDSENRTDINWRFSNEHAVSFSYFYCIDISMLMKIFVFPVNAEINVKFYLIEWTKMLTNA